MKKKGAGGKPELYNPTNGRYISRIYPRTTSKNTILFIKIHPNINCALSDALMHNCSGINLVLSTHARFRLKERGIKNEWLIDTLIGAKEISETKYDQGGVPCRIMTGNVVTLIYNPISGVIATAWVTKRPVFNRLRRQDMKNEQFNHRDFEIYK